MTMIIALASPRVAVLGMEWITDASRQIAAVVVDADGEIQGLQTKNQLRKEMERPTPAVERTEPNSAVPLLTAIPLGRREHTSSHHHPTSEVP